MTLNWQFEGTKSRNNLTQQLIVKWLQEREELFRLYFETISRPWSENADAKETWQAFGQVLMDYLSFGHFRVYNELEHGTNAQNQSLLADLRQTTDKLVNFNDRYFDAGEDELPMHGYVNQLNLLFAGRIDDTAKAELLAKLSQDLSDLGETLGHHVDLEDQLLGQYLKRVSQILPVILSKAADSVRQAAQHAQSELAMTKPLPGLHNPVLPRPKPIK